VKADFEFIVESVRDAVLIVSAEGQIVRINAEAERMFGYPRQELVGQPLETVLPAGASIRAMAEVADSLARRRDGHEFFVDVSLSPATAGGVIAIARDVSDRKRMNQELGRQTSILESILNSMGEGVIVCDQTGKLLLVNPAGLRLHPTLRGREKPGVAVYQEFGLFLPDKLTPYPADELPLARVLRGEVVDGLEMFVRAPHVPEGIWTTVTARPLRDANGSFAGGVVVIHDTTAIKFAQGALLAGQEAEGKRIARELHDSVSQDLCCLILDMAQFQRELPGSLGKVSDRINSQKEKLMEVAEAVDSVCRQLHPSVLERIGLNQALAHLCTEFNNRKGLHIRFSHGEIPTALPAASALCLYRVAQEALRNIVRHANARYATVLISAA